MSDFAEDPMHPDVIFLGGLLAAGLVGGVGGVGLRTCSPRWCPTCGWTLRCPNCPPIQLQTGRTPSSAQTRPGR